MAQFGEERRAQGEADMAGKTYEGEAIAVNFDMQRCIHSRNCYLKLSEVFDPGKRPWVQPDAGRAEEIAAVVRSCPSGALTYARRDGGPEEEAPGINRLRILENGPVAVEGEISVEGAAPVTRATLCRCGASQNKPYCDFAHEKAGFRATGEPSPEFEGAAKETSGALEARRIKDGPLMIAGNVEVISGTGHKLATAKKVFLCRCGASKNKPFCDGSHKDAGFSDGA